MLINFLTVIVPLIFSFHKKIQFNKKFKSFFVANFLSAFIFIVWDILFTAKGIWGFNPKYVLGIYIFNLPLEECLFFICVPFSCSFTFYTLQLFINIKWKQNLEKFFFVFLILILLIIGFSNLEKLYTSVTFISLAIFLCLLKFQLKVTWLNSFMAIYLVLLIPFFIVNGALTGAFTDEPIVWYNNVQNLNFRLITIPIEDIFYGFELMLLNLFFYHFLEAKSSPKNGSK